MPGTTRYSATFDRPYEEDDRVDPPPPPNARRSRSQSWQANSGLDNRPYTPLGGRFPTQRSSSTDNGPSKVTEHIPTRTVTKTVVKPHTNPFQFVKVGTCPLYKKAEEQLKKVKEVKKPDVLKEEEEEWQTNLDSWKSRRRKMSEDVFRRQEEIKQLELEEQVAQVSQKKTKTFSEMVESRAHRGRALSLCLISSPMELQNWEFEKSSHTNGSCSTFSGESEENSTANSEDEGVSLKGMLEKSPNINHDSHRINGNSHIENSNSDCHNGNYSKLSDISNSSLQMKPKEGSYIDSGLESISSHRAGDTPDSGSDFSHDGGSSIDCDSPRTGVNILEEFSTKSSQLSSRDEVSVKLCSNQKGQDFGFTFLGGKDKGQFLIASILEGSKADLSFIHLGDQIVSIDGIEIASKTHREVSSLIEKAKERGKINLLLWRHMKCNSSDSSNHVSVNGKQSNGIKLSDNQMSHKSQSYEKSIESENEMFVDDFEELERQSELAASLNKSQANDSNPANDVIPSVVLTDVTPLSKTGTLNGSVLESCKTPQNSSSEASKNAEKKSDDVPKTKTRRKGVYALNVSSTPQNSKEGFSVNSLFPLSPVTELPSPEDAKTMASTLSSEITSVSEDSTNLKESKSEDVKASSDKKENSDSLTNGENEGSKNVLNGEVSSSKEEIKNSVIPTSPVVSKCVKTHVTSDIAAEKKTKIVKKVKAKAKKDSTAENLSSVASQPIREPALNASSSDKPKNIENDFTKKSDIEASNIKTNIECTEAISSDSTNKNVSVPASKSSQSALIIAPKPSASNLGKTPVKDMSKSKSVETSSSNGTQSKAESCFQENSKTSFVQRKTSNSKDIEKLTLKINVTSNEPAKGKSPKTPVTPKTASPNKDTDNKSTQVVAVDSTPPATNSQENTPKSPRLKKNKTRTRKKNPNSPKANASVQQLEESSTSNSVDTLNVIFQSQPKNVNSENLSNKLKTLESNSNKTSGDLVANILPVEKVAEEMEKLILQQLEEEERAKELASGLQTKSPFSSPEHLLTAPPKLAEPPKEKPPPPPPVSEGTPKDSSLNRANSTNRIKKEIHKRRSNFLGIENENIVANEPSIPPPPALEEILKAEMELDRQTRLQIENAAAERLTLEEKELMQREREIIETLESEERQKQLINNVEEFYDSVQSNENDTTVEQQLEFLKSEQKRLELEKINEEQQLRLLEETQLRELKEREEFIRKQEADKSPVSEPSSLSVAPQDSITLLSSLSVDTPKSHVSNSGAFGDGKSLSSNSDSDISKSKCLDSAATKVAQKPSVPPKPLKKKEAIRKERERLRQEQEALQREREEHRLKLLQEQEELAKQQKPHAPDAPVSRLGPLSPTVPPSFHPPLTATPFTRDAVSYPSRSHHGASNIPVGNINSAEIMAPVVAKQGPMPTARKPVQNESWGQQKGNGKIATKSVTISSSKNTEKVLQDANTKDSSQEQVRDEQTVDTKVGSGGKKKGRKVKKVKKKVTSVQKQNQDSLSESRYNQNHWLIQEAEMRRIAELKDRQRRAQLSRSQPNLAEDDVCSNAPRGPVVSPPHNLHMNYPVQEKMWSYNQPNGMPVKKYPPVKEQLHVIYPREPVPQQPPPKPSRVVPIERPEQMLSVSGRKRCSHCNEELGRGAAMIIESLQLYYHIHCFQCCVCQAQLGNGSCGTDVRVRNQKLHCHNCYSNDEAGLKFSQV